ncbi:nuclear transcription factor Y subunit B-6-like [Impatiens glandulifera]|uniref:nuclear transcription factor Y subunit B-6-like n=1 Tax=Impatiens glandulifera TaxID=253017 RepID=UPI001FB0660E|nr:nuclear transcription factor Y subunit B-6-like [Impatiens glandulifera]
MENKGSSTRAYVVPPTEPFIPVANVVRIMRRVVPTHCKIADDVKEFVQHCVLEFISLITVEANMHCQSESRRTITADDILWAMAKLGFDDYVNTARDAVGSHGSWNVMNGKRGRDDSSCSSDPNAGP